MVIHSVCMIRAKTFILLRGKQRPKKNLLLITQLLYEEQGIKDFKRFTLILWL